MIAQNVFLYSYLAPFEPWLKRDDVTDIYVNRPEELWVEYLGGAIERYDAPQLGTNVLLRLARQIAAISSQGISRESPLLAASLPDGSRVQVVLAPATRGDVAIAIRRHVAQDLTLDDYRDAISCAKITTLDETARDPFSQSGDVLEDLRQAVLNRRNILVSGGTSSGKTTLLNALTREIPPSERLIVIEDAPELQLHHDNALGLIAVRGPQGEADVVAEDLLIAALRMRPDRIILGEIRGGEALTFLRAVNTGHPGSLTTIHADSPDRAIDQLALLALQAGSRLSWDDTVRYIHRSIDVVVQLGRVDGIRTIRALAIG